MNSKHKGTRGEKEVELLFRRQGFFARVGKQGKGGKKTPDVVTKIPIHIEVKRVEKLNLWRSIDQAEEDSEGLPYVIFTRRNQAEWNVVVHWKFFFTLLKSYLSLKKLIMDKRINE